MKILLLPILALAAVTAACKPMTTRDKTEEGEAGEQFDMDGDGWLVGVGGDCDDGDASVHPGAAERCDGVDHDCDGDIYEYDAVDRVAWYPDADGDGHGAAGSDSLLACLAPEGTVANDDDCDDGRADVHPDALERCGGVDHDCDGLVNEEGSEGATAWYPDVDGDGWGQGEEGIVACVPPPGHGAPFDCDDARADVHPDADERCDGVDHDCDGATNEADSVDAGSWYQDLDGDGHYDDGSRGHVVRACTAPAGTRATGDDCDDTASGVHPGAPEWCDGSVDDDCDGLVDGLGCFQPHCGTLDRSETWDADYRHFVTCDVLVEGSAGPTLTVEAGAEVFFAAGTRLGVGESAVGRLEAEGTYGRPVRFTSGSLYETGRSPRAGDWQGLELGANAQATLRYGILEYGGGADDADPPTRAGLRVEGASPLVSDCAVQSNNNAGVLVVGGGAPDLSDSDILDNFGYGVFVDDDSDLAGMPSSVSGHDDYPMSLPFLAADAPDESTSFTRNDLNYIELRGGVTLASALEIHPASVPYVVDSDVAIRGSSARLTLTEGVILYFAEDAGLSVGSSTLAGRLDVEGSDPSSILLTAWSPSRGWDGITVASNASTRITLEGVTLSYGGGNGYGNLYVAGQADPSISSCAFTHSRTHGAWFGASSTPSILESEFTDNAGMGVYLDTDAGLYAAGSTPTFAYNTLSGNGSYPLSMPPGSIGSMGGWSGGLGNQMYDNAIDAIYVYAGSVTSNATWRDQQVPYRLMGDVVIGTSGGATVTLMGGARFEVDRGVMIGVGTMYSGGLITESSPSEDIVFQQIGSTCGSGAHWDGITFGTGVTSSSYTLTRLVVRCGPSSGNLYVSDGVTLRLRSCEISGAEGYGIYNYKGDVSLDGCTVHENASYGVYVATYGTLGDVTGCDFHDNLTPIRVPPNYLSEIDASNDLDGNVNDYVEVASGDVTSTGTWYDLGIPARFTGSVNIYSTITIQDGAEFEFEPSTGLKIGTTVSGGSLIANGSTYGIRFTSAAATPAAGDWYGLAFGSHTGLANLTGVTISHGGKTGGYSTCNGNLCFRASSGSVTNSVLSHSSGYGLYCALMSGKTLTRTGNTYTSNTLGSVSSDCP